jgi:uncharacterized protein (DUF433 family)
MATLNVPTQRIIRDPSILGGKPVVKGTRISVETVLAHLAADPSLDELLAAFPRLTVEDVKACLAFAEERVRLGGSRAAAGR